MPRQLARHDAQTPPWDIGRPQPAFRALAEAGAIRGRVLDIGCGAGEHVLMAAQDGHDATGVDISSTGLTAAKRKADQRGLSARFFEHDVCALGELGEQFDTGLDCGLCHALTRARRASLVGTLRFVIQPGGRYFILGGWEPHRLDRLTIRAAFHPAVAHRRHRAGHRRGEPATRQPPRSARQTHPHLIAPNAHPEETACPASKPASTRAGPTGTSASSANMRRR